MLWKFFCFKMKCRGNMWLYISLLYIKMLQTFPKYAKLSLTACLKILCSDPRNRYPKLKSPSTQHWHDRLLPLHQAKCMWRRSENQEDTKEGARTPSEAAAVSSRTSWWRPPICSWIRASFSIRQIEYRVFSINRNLLILPSCDLKHIGGKARPRTMTHTLPSKV